MKLLFVCHYFLPHMGGIENVVYHEANGLTDLGAKITVLTSRIPGKEYRSPLPKIKIIRIGALNIFENLFGIPYPIFSPDIITALWREIKNNDITHVHGHMYLSSFVAAVFSRILHKPLILTQQNTFIEYKNPFLRAIENIVDKTIGAFTLKTAKAVIVPSLKTKNYVSSIVKNIACPLVMPNGVDTDKFSPPKNKIYIRKQLSLPGKFICLTVRRITFKNGLDTLLESAKLLKNNTDITFIIGGTGPDEIMMKKYISTNNLKNVRCVGFISDSDLPLYYQASNLFILPSKKGEGLPLVVLEAFSSGIPVIATKSGGHEEIILNDQTGFLTKVGDARAISKNINYLFKNPNILSKMSVNCRRLAVRDYSWNNHNRKLLYLYKQVLL